MKAKLSDLGTRAVLTGVQTFLSVVTAAGYDLLTADWKAAAVLSAQAAALSALMTIRSWSHS